MKKKPKLKNIVILGQFSDKKVRQIICTEEHQIGVIHTLRAMQPDGTVHVLDKPMEAIEWESEVNLSEKIK